MHADPEDSISRLRTEFEKLPGIGRKTAERLAYYILKSPRDDALALAGAIKTVKEKARHCPVCFTVTESETCRICSDDRRDASTICVIEEPRDVDRIEESGNYRGLYHVLMGHVSPLDGIIPGDLTIGALMNRVKRGGVKEVIIATNPTVEGDATAMALSNALGGSEVRVTRLARGLPSGASLEYTNKSIIADAMEGRRDYRNAKTGKETGK